MKRMNFPGRKQIRRDDAKSRDEAYQKLSIDAKRHRNSKKVRAKLG